MFVPPLVSVCILHLCYRAAERSDESWCLCPWSAPEGRVQCGVGAHVCRYMSSRAFDHVHCVSEGVGQFVYRLLNNGIE